MFRWAAAQPLPSRLLDLLDRVGIEACPWEEKTSEDIVLFLPPHLLMQAGIFPHTALLTSYELIRRDCDRHSGSLRLINGERLLGCSADELRGWRFDRPLPTSASLQPVQALSGALTRALLDADSSLADHYQWLDTNSERGGAEPDLHYRERLLCFDPQSLVEAWNELSEARSRELDIDSLTEQLLALEDEFEQFVLAGRDRELAAMEEFQRGIHERDLALAELSKKLSWNRMGREQALYQLRLQQDLLKKVATLSARMASCVSL